MKLGKNDLIRLYRNMLFGRKIDELMVKGLKEGKVCAFYHSGQGSEALGAGVASFLRKDDYIYGHHRGHGITYIISKGGSVLEFVAEHYGKSAGCCHGISGFHFVSPEFGMMGSSGTIGSQFPLSLGWGLACKKNGREQVTVGCFGDGSSNRGTLHEAFNLSSLWKLPIVWVCDNNGVAQWMPIKDAYPREDIADLAAGYDMPGVVVDGMDVIAVHEAVQAAVERARKGYGPSLIEAKTVRFRAHSEGSPDVFHFEKRPEDLIQAAVEKDPIPAFAEKLLAQQVLSQSDIEAIDRELDETVADIDRQATESQPPDPSIMAQNLYMA